MSINYHSDGSDMKPFRTMYLSPSGHWLTHSASDTQGEAWDVDVPEDAPKKVVRLVECDPPKPPQDTLPQWLYKRFGRGVPNFQGEFVWGNDYAPTYGQSRCDWADLSAGDQEYWQHDAAAVRRAVARNGFKEV